MKQASTSQAGTSASTSNLADSSDASVDENFHQEVEENDSGSDNVIGGEEEDQNVEESDEDAHQQSSDDSQSEGGEGEETDNENAPVPQAEVTETATTYIAKDKTVWRKDPVPENRPGSRNILRQASGPDRSTQMLSMSDTLKKIITPDMIILIARYTNIKALQCYAAHNNLHPEKQHQWTPVTEQEIYAFIGILLFAGVTNSNTDDLKDLWKPTSHPIYRATFGINRFWSILRFIRFDDSRTRTARVQADKAAPIQDIWIMLVDNLSTMYKPTGKIRIFLSTIIV